MNGTNPYCETLGIEVPRLEAVAGEREEGAFALLVVALLERGAPMTLEEAARRFEEAGLAPAEGALAALKLCRPARLPIFRDGDLYGLDPHGDEAKRWAWRLGLKRPQPQGKERAAATAPVIPPDPAPLPRLDQPLTAANLDEAWREGVPRAWSPHRVAICVLDAHRAAMRPEDVAAFVKARSEWNPLSGESPRSWRRVAAIRTLADGSWALIPEHDAVRSARQAVSALIAKVRRLAAMRPDPAATEAIRVRIEREHNALLARLAAMRRAVVRAFPAVEPEAIVIIDAGSREIAFFAGEEIAKAKEKLRGYDAIAAMNVWPLLRILDFEPGERRLHELSPPQKARRLNKRGRTLKITADLLVRGSCGISRPFGDAVVLRGYLVRGELTKFRRRLEADAKSLYALYQYGRLHGALRLRWGFLDEMIPAPWVLRGEPTLYNLMARAETGGLPLEVVTGSAPGWAEPWSRARRAFVRRDTTHRWRELCDEHGDWINEADIQAARLVEQG